MSFLSRGFHHEADYSSFTPLFRLLDDFDSYAKHGAGHGHGRRSISTWQPRFDVRETGEAYELHGELPGMNKDNVHVDFTEPQTMTVRGKTERTYSSPPSSSSDTPPAAGQVQDVTEKPALAQGEQEAAAPHTANEAETALDRTPAQDRCKYWLTERSVGEFSRTFTFPTPVDHDSVAADFKDGILSVTVPKAKKTESRRITIN